MCTPVSVGDEAEDGNIFGQHFAVVELQDGYIALGVDVEEGSAVFQLVRLEIHLHQVELHARLMQCLSWIVVTIQPSLEASLLVFATSHDGIRPWNALRAFGVEMAVIR